MIWREGLELSSGFLQFSNLLQLLSNQFFQDFIVSFFLEKLNKGQLNMVIANYWK